MCVVCIYRIGFNCGHSHINALSYLVAGDRECYNKIKHSGFQIDLGAVIVFAHHISSSP